MTIQIYSSNYKAETYKNFLRTLEKNRTRSSSEIIFISLYYIITDIIIYQY